MDKTSVKAEILGLSGSILAGKATDEEIAAVTAKAVEVGLEDFLAAEFEDIQRILG